MSGPAGTDAPGYDDVPAPEQARVRAEWARRMERRLAELDLTREFVAAGESYAELDEHGHVVWRQPPTQQ